MGSSFIRYVLGRADFSGKISNIDALTYAANLENLEAVAMHPNYHFYHGDIRDREFLNSIESVDVIVHFAAETHVDRSIDNPELFLATNVCGTQQLLEFARERSHIHFHQISTDEVYGTLGDEGVFTEDTPYRPNSPYSASKASADHLVRSYAQTYGLSTTISHASNNYGPGQYPEKFIPLMIQRAKERRSLPVYGTGHNQREWLFVEDHSRAIWTILGRGRRGDVYNVGGQDEWRNIDLLHVLLELLGDSELKQLITYIKDRPGHDFRYAMDSSKMRSLGWKPEWSIYDGLQETIRWYDKVSS